MGPLRSASASAMACGLAMALGTIAMAQHAPAPYRPELPSGLDLYFPVPE